MAATRLRFLFVFAVVFVVIGSWETIRAYWARLMTSATNQTAISSDTEYFCPMDPGIVSDWPSKCPICNMTLVRRKRGESAPLPNGVMARMQFTPYRLSLGGIRTATVEYAPLSRTFEVRGIVVDLESGHCRIKADIFDRELAWIEVGQAAEILSAAEEGRPPALGKVHERPPSVAPGGTGTIGVALESRIESLRAGDRVRVRILCPVETIEPFRSQPKTPPSLTPGEPRRLYTCMEHPDVVRDVAARCPRDGSDLMARPLRITQRVRWWCPMHPNVTAEKSGSKCDACGGMALVLRVVSYRTPGSVLAVPCSAVVDDGLQCLVYLDRGAGMFDAKVVTLGPRCGAMFPVISGLDPGDRVVAQGALLLDAETRLDPSLAASYFGAGEGAPASKPAAPASVAAEETWLTELTEADRPFALRQKTCPVTGKALGSMGVPRKIMIHGQPVFLCCQGCTATVDAEPEKYMPKFLPSGAERRP